MKKKKTGRRKRKISTDSIIVRRRVVEKKICPNCKLRKDIIYFDTFDVRKQKPEMVIYFCSDCIKDFINKSEDENNIFNIYQYMLDPSYNLTEIEEIIDEDTIENNGHNADNYVDNGDDIIDINNRGEEKVLEIVNEKSEPESEPENYSFGGVDVADSDNESVTEKISEKK